MSKNLWQSIYDSIKNFHSPQWLKSIMQTLQDLMVEVLCQVGKEYLSQIEAKIVEASSLNKTNDQKFMIVFNFTKSLIPGIKDSIANLLIEMLFQKFKQSGYTA